VDSSHEGLRVSRESLPFVSTEPEILNAYLLNFFSHGQQRALIRDNLISENSVYRMLEDVRLLIKTIAVSLEDFTSEILGGDPVAHAFRSLSDGFEGKMRGAFRAFRE